MSVKGAPQAASTEMIAATLRSGGDSACEQLMAQLRHKEKPVAERASRTLKKISQANGAALYRWRKTLIAEALRAKDVRVQWNLSLMLGRLPLRGSDKALVVDLMFERLRDHSGLNRTCAMQALMDLSGNDPALRARVALVVQEFLANGTPAMRARARKLLPLL